MKEIAISEFKAKCLALLGQVEKSRNPIRVTRRGKAVADVFPPSPEEVSDWMGSMKREIEIIDDIVGPARKDSDAKATTK
jgi:antitoxin (DNA-binding transcriptional repressor) of toxin-antitoxin stability system